MLHFDTPRGGLRTRLLLDPLFIYSLAHHVGSSVGDTSKRVVDDSNRENDEDPYCGAALTAQQLEVILKFFEEQQETIFCFN